MRKHEMETEQFSLFFLVIAAYVNADYVNVAVNKTTTQSGEIWPSGNAVDGTKYCPFVNGTYYTLTDNLKLPSWQVDLGDLFRIEQINVYGRHDSHKNQLQGFQLFLSPTDNFDKQSEPVYTNTAADYNSGSIIIPSIPLGLYRYVKLDLPGTYRAFKDTNNNTKQTGPLVLCEVEVLVNVFNIATLVSIQRSSVLSYAKKNYSEVNVIDENPLSDPDVCECCWSSANEQNPWLEMVIPFRAPIVTVNVIGRTDTLYLAELNRNLVGLKVTIDNNVVPNNRIKYNSTENAVTIYPQTPTVKNIKFTRPGNGGEWYLAICEIKINRKDCESGHYGPQCESCNKCELNTVCNSATGVCPNGCQPGYKGEKCDLPCSHGSYGKGCANVCGHCKNNQSCHHVSGNCTSGCATGYDYSDKLCNTRCHYGTYGQGCANICGNCENNQTCHHVTGKCISGCGIGFDKSDRLCKTPCDATHFGKGCKDVCHCKNDATCDNNNGMCPSGGCAAGWQGQACDKMCNNGTFGLRCNNTCGKCANFITCNNVDGTCPKGCLPGYIYSDNLCNTECQPGFYGNNCSRLCGNCSGEATCNISTGYCKHDCGPGYRESKCDKKCNDNMFGSNCVHQCHCANNSQCDISYGYCSMGCDVGWTGTSCSIDRNILQRHSISTNVTQSHTYSTCTAFHAIDGIDRPVKGYHYKELCEACSVAEKNGTYAWWQLDLGDLFLVQYIRIFGRPDNNQGQSQNVNAFISNFSMHGNPTGFSVPINFSTGQEFLTNLSTPHLFRFLQIQKKHAGVLILCEVKLYEAACPRGSYGQGCANVCGHCKNNQTCNHATGNCTSGCDIGYYNSDNLCKTSCNHGTFGSNCASSCHCLDDSSCDPVSGKCSVSFCNPGWQGSSCDRGCDHRYFGYNCSSRCNCRDNSACDEVSGDCDTGLCDPGWFGSRCDKAETIMQLLNNSVKTSMSSVASNRTSDLAIDGNIGPDPDQCQCCSETKNAQQSWWLVDFGQTIPVNRIIVYSRNKENEFHHLDGFQLNFSNNIFFNSSTFSSSSTAMSGEKYEISIPNILTRQIKIERPGVLTLCEVQVYKGECEIGTFGHECSQKCHCADNQPCAQVTGVCQTSACKTGWMGSACHLKCLPDTFGDECREKCYCKAGTCTSNYGICPGKCRQGYHGPHCNEVGSEIQNQTDHQDDSDYTSATVVAGAVSGSLAFVTVIVAGVIIYKYRKKQRSTTKHYATPNVHVTPTESPDYDTLDNLNDVPGSSNNDYENERVTDF